MTGGRPYKLTVEYFPHSVSHGRIVYILEEAYGNDGYSFWFKLQEILGETAGHYINCQKPGSWEHLIGRTRVKTGKAKLILETLANLEAIDRELWEKAYVIWSQDFIDSLEPVYRKRNNDLPERPDDKLNLAIPGDQKELFGSFGSGKGKNQGLSDTKEVKEVKEVKKSKGSIQAGTIEEIQNDRFSRFWNVYPKKVSKGAARKTWKKIAPSDELLNKMISSIEIRKTTNDWKKKGGKFIPYPSTWLNAEGWDDELPELAERTAWIPPEHRTAKEMA